MKGDRLLLLRSPSGPPTPLCLVLIRPSQPSGELGLSTETADSSLVQPSTSEAVVQDSWTPSLISPEEILRPPLRASLRCPRSPRGWRWGTPCPPPGHPSSTLNLLMTQDRLGPSHPLARGPTQFYFTNYQRGRGQFWGVSGDPVPFWREPRFSLHLRGSTDRREET